MEDFKMKVEQIYSLMNDVTKEILGKTGIVKEDLSNTVDIGTELFDATSVDNYVKVLVDHIGRMIFVTKKYTGRVPSVAMDAWEFGSVVEKVQADLPDAVINDTWNLTDKETYNQDIFYKPSVSAKFFNKRVTFEVPVSITDRQCKSAFTNAQQLNSFISMIYVAVENSMTVKLDALIMRSINNMIAEVIHANYTDGIYTGKSTVQAVNLLKMYNDKFGTTLTASQAMTNAEFIRFASMIMNMYIARLGVLSTEFNVGGKERFTSKDRLSVVLLNDFTSAADMYLQADTFHNELTKLPNSDIIPYWQGSGQDYSFEHNSHIHVTDASGDEINITGVLGVMFDRDAVGVSCLDRYVTSHYNARGEFTNNFYKMIAGYFNDLNENFVVFFAA